ncbi:flagellin lysine-N-methylase [Fibrobacter sp. UWB11]|uniref:flagellin lysine-N-methylase n=1 Tax=Fibrobacter sp. UWB11 TaxID=1896202 RepID=UPI00092C4E81|nr:flagellin lysine-N-methylase [Fibrobacter sp. UWB11]SIO45587.1 lysine-N-methylase [Fibrobacter sp. UWB11]
MLLRVPDFYDSFHCIAGKCTDTCCVGWEIDIDDESAKRYAKIKGPFGEKLRENIEDGHFKLSPGDRCPFLRQDGLCDMICHLGEDSLCDICREHPRFVEVYGDIMEKGIGLCCEEGVRLLLESKSTATSPIAFVEREIDDEPDDIPDDALEARDAIFEERNHLFKILADHSKPLNERLIELLDFAVETSGFEDFEQSFNSNPTESTDSASNTKISNNILGSWIEVLSKGESYGPAWDSAYKELLQSSTGMSVGLFTDSDGEKIIAYLLFRYYEKSLFDGNSLTKVEFAIYFWIIVQKLGPFLTKIDAIKLLSKQTEYSEEIMGILEEEFMENPLFSPENFKRILRE